MKIEDIELKWLGHSSFMIKNSKVIYIDPFKISEGREKADIILITHDHFDHCSVEDMEKIIKEGTKIFAPADCQSKIAKFKTPVDAEIVEPDREFSYGNIKIDTIPAYNIDKSFHPKEEGWVGYVVKMNDVLVYHAGDTDVIPEMQKLTGYKQPGKIFIALLPIGGRFTMTAEEAAEAAKIIKPSLAIPMHFGNIIGTEQDAKEFVELCKEHGVSAEILQRE
ncbi:MAG TPA: MBL fold metallo-hydrolase [Patescibacteria group bacterium]|nr:MBL fold metallo-hydrolase [Patescibacteria group bacterium]